MTVSEVLDWKLVVAILAAIISLLSLIVAAGRTPPGEAQTNLVKWAIFFRLRKPPGWVRSKKVDSWMLLVTPIVAVVSGALSTYVGTTVYLKHKGLADLRTERTERELWEREQASRQQFTSTMLYQSDLIKWQKSGQTRPLSNYIPFKFEMLSDAGRWHYATILRQTSSVSESDRQCEVRLWTTKDSTSQTFADEVSQIISAAGWHIRPGKAPRTYYSPGIAINTAEKTSRSFRCGYLLSDFMQILTGKPDLRPGIESPDLKECEHCVELVIGAPGNG